MTQQEPRIVRFGDGFSYSDTATRRLFGDSASVDVLENFDRCLEAACADGSTVAVVPVHNTENGDITGTGGVPLADMARSMGLRVLSTLELPVDHVLASFGSLEEIKIVYSKDVALGQCSKFIERYGMRSASIVPGKSVPLSTAGAAIYVAGKRVRVIAAICSEEAASHYGVPIVRRNITNSPDNRTTFHAYARADASIPEGLAGAARRAGGRQ
ncbi:MAG: hypothetical protein EB824_06905 [Thaumarchaeota archaeon S15]|nr:MAG: hypothetical protein EB824_06905 [Thaumarchaeota archaeon S15]RNJ73368.1 MAG: hypothetical protein EB833_02980 [Thaumarchaeota archaeon S13]